MKRKATNIVRNIYSLVVGVSIFFVGMAMEVEAQYYTTNTSQLYENSYYLVETYTDDISELSQIISMEAEDELLKDILEEVAQKANLGISYNAELDFMNDKITISLEQVTVGAILQKVLADTKYKAAISRTREIVFVRRASLKKTSQEMLQDISGQVVNAENGNTLPGVNVYVKGTSTGTTTDTEGRFSLTVDDDAEILVFSFVGFKQLELPIGDRTTFNVELQPDVESLEDVVVVGYGTQQETEVTGSISSIDTEELEGVPEASFENALQGKMAGVNVTSSTGEPGSSPKINVRGTGSISAGNDPLIVIDGLPISNNSDLQGGLETRRASFQPPTANPLATINPRNIESIEVLKDASASAIYGSRGSNGVVLITTKSGSSESDIQVNFSAYGGVSTTTNEPDMMNAQELIDYTQDSRNNALRQDYPDVDFNPETNEGRIDPETGDQLAENYLLPQKYVEWNGTDTDWLALVLSDATVQSYDLSISGGSPNIRYSISGGYLDQEGTVEGTSFDRYSLNTNITADVSDPIEVGLHLNGAFTKHQRLPTNAPYFAQPPGIIYSAMVHSPVIEPRNSDGSPNQLNGQAYLGGGTTDASNPLAIMDAADESISNNRLFGNVYGQYDISDHFQFKTMVGFDIDDYQRSFYLGNDLLFRTNTKPEPYAQSSAAQGFNWLWENTLNYTNDFGNHSVTALVGYTAQKQENERNSVFAENFPDDQVKTISGGIVTSGDQIKEEWSLVSTLARINYTFKDRYLLTATIRSDRSSRFGDNNQTGVFPSGSIGWRITEEPFMSEQELFSELKPRISYGVTGNFSIPNYGSIGLLKETNYVLNNEEISGLAQQTIGDEELSWETTYTLDVGLDFAFLNDRIYGAIDYYNSQTEDLLLNVTIPAITGFNTALTNIGEVSNKGIEFQITSRNIVGGFEWATDFNFGTNRNEVKALGPQGDPILSAGGAGQRHITRVGDEIGSYYGYVVDGIYQSQEEIDNAPNDTQVGAGGARPGDFRFKDVNGDGEITPDDRTVTGSYHPDFTYGLTNRFNYKGVDLSIFIQGVEGREILNLTARHMRNGEANFNSYAVLNDRWQSPENPGNGEHPRADRLTGTHGNNNRPSSYQVEDGSYVRIKRVTLGYTFSTDLIDKYAQSIRIYGSANNIATFTDYTGFNPEVSLQANSSLTPGEDYGAYPLARTIQLGIDISF